MKYKWNYDRLTAMLVVLSNFIITAIILTISLLEDKFMKHQFGFAEEPAFAIKIGFVLVVLIGVIALNLKFLQKSQKHRMILALYQTIILSFAIRNIVFVFVNKNFIINYYMLNCVIAVVLSATVYNTLFSKQINDYFNLTKVN